MPAEVEIPAPVRTAMEGECFCRKVDKRSASLIKVDVDDVVEVSEGGDGTKRDLEERWRRVQNRNRSSIRAV